MTQVMRPEEPAALNAMIASAIDKGAAVETLERLFALYKEDKAMRAAAEYAAAMAAFQAACPAVCKSSTAKIATKSGSSYSYTYAELDQIAETVNPILAKHGLSYGWDADFPDPKRLRCICTVRHVAGHSESSKFELPIDSASAMSDQQKVGAALTFAKRQSLTMRLGITTTDNDTDGVAPQHLAPITDDQVAFLNDLIGEHAIPRDKFLKHLGVGTLAEIRNGEYNRAVNIINETVARRSAAK